MRKMKKMKSNLNYNPPPSKKRKEKKIESPSPVSKRDVRKHLCVHTIWLEEATFAVIVKYIAILFDEKHINN